MKMVIKCKLRKEKTVHKYKKKEKASMKLSSDLLENGKCI